MQIQCSASSFLRSSFNDAQQLGQQIGSQNMCITLHHVTMRFKDSMIGVFFTYHISYQCQCLQLQIVHIIMYLSRIYFGTGVVKSSMSCYVMLCHVCLLQVCKTFEQLPSSGKQWRWLSWFHDQLLACISTLEAMQTWLSKTSMDETCFLVLMSLDCSFPLRGSCAGFTAFGEIPTICLWIRLMRLGCITSELFQSLISLGTGAKGVWWFEFFRVDYGWVAKVSRPKPSVAISSLLFLHLRAAVERPRLRLMSTTCFMVPAWNCALFVSVPGIGQGPAGRVCHEDINHIYIVSSTRGCLLQTTQKFVLHRSSCYHWDTQSRISSAHPSIPQRPGILSKVLDQNQPSLLPKVPRKKSQISAWARVCSRFSLSSSLSISFSLMSNSSRTL